MVVPYWTTQNRFPVLLGMLVDHPLIMTASLNILYLLTHPTTPHPLNPKLKLLVTHISGETSSQMFLQQHNIFLPSYRKSTRGRYNSVLQQCHDFCGREETNYLLPDVTSVLKFFTMLYEKGCQYGSISLALASVVTTLSDHPLIKHFLKGVYHLRPSKSKYSSDWDADILLRYWQQTENNSLLNLLLELSKKVTTLLVLLHGLRINTIPTFDINLIALSNDTCIFYPSELLKHDQQGRLRDKIIYKKFKS